MSGLNFEGDISEFCDTQLKLVESVLKKQGFNYGKVIVEAVGQKGDNYGANVKRFIYEKSDGSLFKMVCKIAPTVEEIRKMMNADLLFMNEIIMYEEVLPKFNELQNLADVPANERVRFPICFGVLKEAPFETILLEDLKESGFGMLDRLKPLSDTSVRLVMKDLATFHSLSYALKDKEPDTYKNFTEKFFNLWAHMDAIPIWKMYYKLIENDLQSLVDTEKHKQVLKGSLSEIGVKARKLQPYEKTSKYSVIQHGDCWSNNILFRFEEGEIVEKVMIDYQLSKQSNPAADILYFIMTGTDYATRAKHFHEWIDYYHETLEDSLANYGLKSNRIYPKDQLDADLRRYGKLMVSVGFMISFMIVRESKDAVDLKIIETLNTEEAMSDVVKTIGSSNLDDTTSMRLKQKITGLIDSGIELGLI